MSKRFYAVNRETGERWKPVKKTRDVIRQYLVMYDSGYLAVVTQVEYEGSSIHVLNPKEWKTVIETPSLSRA